MRFNASGSNLIIANYEAGNNSATTATAGDYVKLADVEAVRQQLGSRIIAATGVMNSLDTMRVEGHEEDIAILGADHYYPVVRNLGLLAGRFFDANEVAQRIARGAADGEKLAPDDCSGARRRRSDGRVKLQRAAIHDYRDV